MEPKLAKLIAIIDKKKDARDSHQAKFNDLSAQQDELRMQIDSLNNRIAELEAEKAAIKPELDSFTAEVAELEDALHLIVGDNEQPEEPVAQPVPDVTQAAEPAPAQYINTLSL